jgi:hypothetical protein
MVAVEIALIDQPAQVNGLAQMAGDRAVRPPQLALGYVADLAVRMQAGLEKDVLDVCVADAVNRT